MTRILFVRTCAADMTAHDGFRWPTSGIVKPEVWCADGECGNGLHGFLWGWGDPELCAWSDNAKWLLCSAEWAPDVAQDLDGKIKVAECQVELVGTRAEVCAALWDAGVRGVIVPASRVMATFAWRWWLDMPPEDRASLLLTLPQDIGRDIDGSAAAEDKRALASTAWMLREMTPAWLDLAKFRDEARALRALQVDSWADVRAAMPIIEVVRAKATAAWAAAGVAAWAAAWAAAGVAAWARAAAGAAAGAAARAAAGVAARAAARDAAEAASRIAARDAARAVARDAARAVARAVARDAARAALADTCKTLQTSARAMLVSLAAIKG